MIKSGRLPVTKQQGLTGASSWDPLQVVGVFGDAVQVVVWLHPHAQLAGVGDA